MTRYQRISVCIPLVILMVLAGGCGTQVPSESDTVGFEGEELNLYVAAGLKKPMDTVIAEFEDTTGAVVLVNYGPSGGLFAQIKEGQPCDLYYSADWIYIEKSKGIDKVISEKKFLKDQLVLAVSPTGETKINKIQDLSNPGVCFAICDAQAPCGAYSEEALKSLEIWDEVGNTLKARPSTVNQLAIMIKEDQIDAGLIYSSVANGNQLKYVEVIDEKHSGEIVFGAAIIKGGNEELARAFMDLATERVAEFTKYGWDRYQ